MSRLLPLIMLMIMLTASAIPQKTTRKLPRQAVATSPSAPRLDSIVPAKAEVALSGYDKPLRSRKESLFVTNNTAHYVYGVILTISYSDLQGRQLHERRTTVTCDLPAGATRQLTFPSWDRQQAFYYRLSDKPQRANGTPYDVTCRCDTLLTIINPLTDDARTP